jgi:signal peptidase I
MDLESMKQWAEKGKGADHPHFTTAHVEIETEAAPQPIPLRPRHQTEEEHVSAFAPLPPTDPDDGSDQTPTLPIVLRSRTEPAEPAPPREPSDTPSKWDDFFNITPDSSFESTEPNPGDDTEPSLEGLDAMRAWALRQEESSRATEIPEEFLKPFDWELQEDGSGDVSSASADFPAESSRTSAWEEAEEEELSPEVVLSDGRSFGAEDYSPLASHEFEDKGEAVFAPAAAFEAPATPSVESVSDVLEEDDPLAGLFESAAAMTAPQQEPRKRGRFGRLFGRKKDLDESPPEPAVHSPGDWLVSAEEAEGTEFQTVAPGEWAEDATPVEAMDEAAASGAGQGASLAPASVDRDMGEEFSTDITEEESPFAQFEAAVFRSEPLRSAVEDDAWAPEPFDSATTPADGQAPAVAVPQFDALPTTDFSSAPWFDHDGPVEARLTEVEPESAGARYDSQAAVLWEPDSENWWTHAEAPASAETLPAPADHVLVTIDSPAEDSEEPLEAMNETGGTADAGVAETPWWEVAGEEHAAEVPVAQAAQAEAAQEPVAEDAPWWEHPAEEPVAEASAAVVAETEVAAEPASVEAPWWEQPTEAEPAVEAPAAVVAEAEAAAEPASVEAPWWEQPTDEEPAVEAPAAVVAEAEAAAEPASVEAPWWEQPTEEPAVEAPAAVVAEAEAAAELSSAETPWWELPADVSTLDVPVAAVGSAEDTDSAIERASAWDPPADDPVAGATPGEPIAESAETAPWWDERTDEPEFEAPAASLVSDDLPGRAPADLPWSVESAELAAPQSILSGEALGESEPSSDEVASDQAPEWTTEPAVSGGPSFSQAGASTEPAAASALPGADRDDPWADFVSGGRKAEGAGVPEAAPAAWQKWESPPTRDEGMWSEVASAAEAGPADTTHEIDLAASLESQMAERSEPAYQWEPEQSDDSAAEWDAAPPATVAAQPGEDENVVLAAFERHAATADALAPRNDEVFEELLGEEAAAIVAEADDDDAGHRSFIKMSGWAPQRGAQGLDGGWAPEQDVEDALSAHQPPAFGGTDGGSFAPPPWALEEFDGEAELPHEKGRHRTKTWIRELVETGLLALLVFLAVRASFQNFKVEGTSMYPTLEDGQFLIVNKLVYSEVNMDKLGNFIPFVDGGSNPERNVFHGPERGDIVVLKDPRNPQTDLIKRVIGLPGETLEIADGKVYINDRLLDEPYIKQAWHDTKSRVTIPPGEYFVMGDNRENSLDSRSSQVGLVPKDLIIGKAMLSYWPSKQFGLAPNEEGKLGEQKPVLTTQRIEGN